MKNAGKTKIPPYPPVAPFGWKGKTTGEGPDKKEKMGSRMRK